MPRKKQAPDSRRRTPRQARAQSKVEAIFEATVQILQREGTAAVNTNRIAERAGVSVSTIYQYFRNKDELLLALARRELGLHQGSMLDVAAAAGSTEVDRLLIRAVLAASTKRNRLRHMVIEIMSAQGRSHELAAPARELDKLIASHRKTVLPSATRDLSPMESFVLVRAVQGAIYAGLREDSPFLHSPQFEDELVRLVRGYLAQLDKAAPSAGA
jgi:AcrR family transcriptional regulator